MVGPVCLVAAVGYIWARSGTKFDVRFVSQLVTHVGTPCLVIDSLTKANLSLSAFGAAGPMHNKQGLDVVLQAMSGHDPKDSTSAPLAVPDFVAAARNPAIKGLRVGIPKEYRADGTAAAVKAVTLEVDVVGAQKLSLAASVGNLSLMLRNILANHARVLWAEPWVDRRGRVAGNWLAFADLLRGRLHPTRVIEI